MDDRRKAEIDLRLAGRDCAGGGRIGCSGFGMKRKGGKTGHGDQGNHWSETEAGHGQSGMNFAPDYRHGTLGEQWGLTTD